MSLVYHGNIMLRVYDHLPAGLLDARVEGLEALLGGPSLIHLPGRREPPLFVSVLLHGNEDTGFYAVQGLLREFGSRPLPRALSLFIGNVAAARHRLRRLDGQPDYNRVWPGGDCDPARPECRMLAGVVETMRQRGVFASLDLHNNTGLNPHYACVNRIDHRFLHLATLFSRTVVYFVRPRGVQTLAFAPICPAVTVECGQPGPQRGVAHAREFLSACLHLAEIPRHPVSPHDLDLYHTVATLRIPDDVSFTFGEAGADLCFSPEFDRLNFRELGPGTPLARLCTAADGRPRVEVVDEAGHDVSGAYLVQVDGELRTRRPVMPSMLTRDARIIRQDCLGYFMERYPLETAS